MRISYFLLPILLFHGFPCVAFAAAVADDQFSFSGFRDTDLNLDGTATVTPEGLLELTNGSVQLKGHAFFPAPFRLRGSPGGAVQSFSASFVFGIVSTYPSLSCHGIAFVVAPSKNFSTALAAQYMGLANIDNNGNASNHIFATELDTMQNIEFEDIDKPRRCQHRRSPLRAVARRRLLRQQRERQLPEHQPHQRQRDAGVGGL